MSVQLLIPSSLLHFKWLHYDAVSYAAITSYFLPTGPQPHSAIGLVLNISFYPLIQCVAPGRILQIPSKHHNY